MSKIIKSNKFLTADESVDALLVQVAKDDSKRRIQFVIATVFGAAFLVAYFGLVIKFMGH